ncbi:MAG: ABC transporter ATP-binding protein [Thermotogae bacterium]|nr:ABC transporter ATP-binding protein [Thermotogota bacterium]
MVTLLRLLFPYWRRVLGGILVLLMVDLGQLVVPQFIRKAVNDIYVGNYTTAPRWAFLIIVVALLFSVLRFFWRYFFIGTSRLLERNLRRKLYEHTVRLDPFFFQRAKIGDVMALFTNDLQAINMALGMGMVAITDFLIYTTFSIIAMLLISPKLTAMVVIPLPLIGVVMFVLGRLIYVRFRQVQDFFGFLTEWLRDILSGIRVVKIYDTQTRLAGRYREISERFLKLNLQFALIDGLFHPAISTLAYVSLAILLLVGGSMTTTGSISLGDYVAFSSYIGMMIWPMVALGWFANLIQRGSASYERIRAYLSRRPLIKDFGNREIKDFERLTAKRLVLSLEGNVILKGVELEVFKGEFVGITGPTGAGKSVLLNTLVRFYQPDSGLVLINGVDYRDLELSSLRSLILLVPQEIFVFSMSIGDNLRVAKPDATEEEMWWALRMAGLEEDVRSMPEGLNTIVGERGVGLSGGQKQRLALARAFLSPAQLILLDESLSALDSQTESKVVESLRKLGKTVILASHRMTSVSRTDRIYVMVGGKITESGTHDQLLRKGEIYPLLWKAHSEGIRGPTPVPSHP